MDKLLNTMTQQSFNLKLNDKTLENRQSAFDQPAYNRMNGINGFKSPLKANQSNYSRSNFTVIENPLEED